MNYLRAIHAHMQQHTDTIARDHRIDTLACVYECVLQCFVCCVHTLSRIVSHIHILFTRVMLPYAIITYSNCKACAVRRHNLTERVICLTHSAYTRASNAQHTHTHIEQSTAYSRLLDKVKFLYSERNHACVIPYHKCTQAPPVSIYIYNTCIDLCYDHWIRFCVMPHAICIYKHAAHTYILSIHILNVCSMRDSNHRREPPRKTGEAMA